MYTMVEMAKANGVNVYHYLTYLLEKLPDDRMSDDDLELLAPWNENVKAEIPCTLIVKVVVSKNIYFLFFQVIRYCSVPDVSINKLSTFIGNHVRHRIRSDYPHFE